MAVWKEQGVTIQVRGTDLVLEAVWQAGALGGGVVAPPHPQYGGSFENPVVNELAFGLHKADFASLRFNWRGVGGSQGSITGDPDVAAADFRTALEHLSETVSGPLIGCGYSFGAAAALRVAPGSSLRQLILVAPPVAMIESLPLAELEIPIHVIAGAEDPFAPAARLSELLEPLPGARLELIPGVDHFFAAGGLAQVTAFAAAAVGA